MAKKKAKSKAKQAKKKPAKPARKVPARKLPKKSDRKMVASAVALEATAEVPAADASRDRELDEGPLASRIVTAVLAGLTAQQNGNSQSGSQPTLGSIQQQLTAIESVLRQSAHAPATPGAPAPQQPGAAVEVSARVILNIRREEIWRAELNQQKPLRLPRPTVVGRAMRELEPERLENPHSFSARRVFQWIRDHGDHHLSVRITQLIGRKGKQASSSISKQWDSRCRRLDRHKLIEVLDDAKHLSGRGHQIFSGWPDWAVADGDADCCGVLGNVTPQ